MSKTPSLAEQLEELEAASELVKQYDKLFDQACQIKFDMTAKELKKALETSSKDKASVSPFEAKVSHTFGLKTESDYADFLAIICSENSLNFFKNAREKMRISAVQQG